MSSAERIAKAPASTALLRWAEPSGRKLVSVFMPWINVSSLCARGGGPPDFGQMAAFFGGLW